MSLRFAIDCDGVLCNFTREVVKTANSLWPGRMPEGFVPDNWNYQGVLTEDEWKQVWKKLMQVENFWLKIEALSGASSLAEFLDKHYDAEVYFITSRADGKGLSVQSQTQDWLYRRGLLPRHGHVIPVKCAADKKDVIKRLNIPFMLDDYAPTVEELQSLPDTKAYVLDAPYNRYSKNLPRVFSVAEYLNKVEEQNVGRDEVGFKIS